MILENTKMCVWCGGDCILEDAISDFGVNKVVDGIGGMIVFTLLLVGNEKEGREMLGGKIGVERVFAKFI